MGKTDSTPRAKHFHAILAREYKDFRYVMIFQVTFAKILSSILGENIAI